MQLYQVKKAYYITIRYFVSRLKSFLFSRAIQYSDIHYIHFQQAKPINCVGVQTFKLTFRIKIHKCSNVALIKTLKLIINYSYVHSRFKFAS